jgi:hypothetical protein
MKKLDLVGQIVKLAQDIESEDPIDFGLLNVDENIAYSLVASKILETYLGNAPEDREMILLAAATKLAVENFVLNVEKRKRNV